MCLKREILEVSVWRRCNRSELMKTPPEPTDDSTWGGSGLWHHCFLFIRLSDRRWCCYLEVFECRPPLRRHLTAETCHLSADDLWGRESQDVGRTADTRHSGEVTTTSPITRPTRRNRFVIVEGDRTNFSELVCLSLRWVSWSHFTLQGLEGALKHTLHVDPSPQSPRVVH